MIDVYVCKSTQSKHGQLTLAVTISESNWHNMRNHITINFRTLHQTMKVWALPSLNMVRFGGKKMRLDIIYMK